MRLRYTPPALAELEEVLDTIASHSPRLHATFRPAFRRSSTFCCFTLFVGTRTNDPTIRRMTTSPYPYLVFYEATDTDIIIHAVRHAARDPSGMPGAW